MPFLRAILQHTIIKQLLGAAMGALVALLLYGAYDLVSTRVFARALPSAMNVFATVKPGERMEQVVLRARQLIEEAK